MAPARSGKVKSVILKKDFDRLMKKVGYLTFKDFHRDWTSEYGFNLTYRSFLRLLDNLAGEWITTYSQTIAEKVGVSTDELFVLVRIE